MANINFVGQIQCEINNVFVISITQMSVNGDRPVNVKFGAQGALGSARGAEKVSASISLAVPVTGLEIDVLGALNAPGGFTFSFPIGAERHALYGCHFSKRGISNNPESGDTSFTLDVVASEWVRVK
jgi:hypothetical protein